MLTRALWPVAFRWEQQANVTDKFTDPFHYRRHNCYWMSDEKNRQGELLLPKSSSYGYSAPDRPFWNYFIQEGDAWFPELSGWAGNPQVTGLCSRSDTSAWQNRRFSLKVGTFHI